MESNPSFTNRFHQNCSSREREVRDRDPIRKDGQDSDSASAVIPLELQGWILAFEGQELPLPR